MRRGESSLEDVRSLDSNSRPLGYESNPRAEVESQVDGRYHRNQSLVLNNSVYSEAGLHGHRNEGLELNEANAWGND